MNTRLLRKTVKTTLGGPVRIFEGIGQLQPVLMGWERGVLTLRIEGVEEGRSCWWRLPLPRYRAKAKALFAELEALTLAGKPSPARAAWDAYKATKP